MNKSNTYNHAILFLGLLLVVTAMFLHKTTHRHPSTWSIVAVDPVTGDVGVAGASCVSIHIDGLAALVPNVGAAVTQAAFTMENRDHVFELLQAGESAEAIIDAVTAEDKQRETRQYAVITIENGATAIKGFTGTDNGDWAGDKQVQDVFAVSVQGNVLENEAVVADALSAFNEGSAGDLTLSDRLMRALEAGSAAGGDTRCNSEDVQQTAASAFIVMARSGDAPFANETMGQSSADSDNPPFLALSVSEPILGANPIPELREQYDGWRGENLSDCTDCDLSAIPVPEGGDSDAARQMQRLTRWGFVTVGLLIVGLLTMGIMRWRKRRKMASKQ